MRIKIPIRLNVERALSGLNYRLQNCHPERSALQRSRRTCFSALASICILLPPLLTSAPAKAQPDQPIVLDRVVAVVNNHAILASDIDNEIRLSVLDPGRGGMGVLTPKRALDQLIGRALIDQQIREEDQQAVEPPQSEVDARMGDIRKELPACVRQDCASDAGWKAFLAAHGLAQQQVEAYLRYRLEILRFIEERFRQGISISSQEIETYYHDTLLPQYAKGDAAPALDKVSSRIEEILLQQRVNALFDDWLSNLRKQGDIEVLDSTLAAQISDGGAPAASGDKKGSQ
jgi:peptidyl-prolyl cis-trans isomerase SurA